MEKRQSVGGGLRNEGGGSLWEDVPILPADHARNTKNPFPPHPLDPHRLHRIADAFVSKTDMYLNNEAMFPKVPTDEMLIEQWNRHEAEREWDAYLKGEPYTYRPCPYIRGTVRNIPPNRDSGIQSGH